MPNPALRPVVKRGRRSAERRARPLRVVRIVAIVLVLLFVVAQLAGGASHGVAGAGTSSNVHGTSHLDEARGHLDAILNLFR